MSRFTIILMNTDFSLKTTEIRRHWNNIFKVVTTTTTKLKPVKLSHRNKNEIKDTADEDKLREFVSSSSIRNAEESSLG